MPNSASKKTLPNRREFLSSVTHDWDTARNRFSRNDFAESNVLGPIDALHLTSNLFHKSLIRESIW